MSTAVAGVDLMVAGAPVIAFVLPTEGMRKQIAADASKAPTPPDVSHPALRSWLETWSPRGATGAIERGLKRAGYRVVAKAMRFIVAGAYGPLPEGELERARQWGIERAQAFRAGQPLPT